MNNFKLKKMLAVSITSVMTAGSVSGLAVSAASAEEASDTSTAASSDTTAERANEKTISATGADANATYSITTKAGPNGTITDSMENVSATGKYTVNVSANDGYVISDVKINGKTVDGFGGGMNTYYCIFDGLDSDKTVEATFTRLVSSGTHKLVYNVTNSEMGTFSVTDAGENGDGQTAVTLPNAERGTVDGLKDGDYYVINAQANDGKVLDKFIVNGVGYDVSGKSAFQFTVSDRADLDIKVTFKDPTQDPTAKYKIEAITGEGGTITGGGEYSANSEVTLTATASEGYVLDSFKVDGQEKLKDADAGNTSMTFTFKALSSDHKVEAHFRSTSVHQEKYTVTTSAGEGGTITQTQQYDNNDDVTIEFKANDGYVISGLTVDGNAVDVGQYQTSGSYSFLAIGHDHTVSVTFKQSDKPTNPSKSSYSVTTTAGEGGTVSASATDLAPGSDYTVTYQANDGYYVKGLMVNGKMKEIPEGQTSGSYSIKNINKDYTVNVVFTTKSFNIYTTAADGGTITAPILNVDGSGSYKIDVTANSGYVISNINIDGVSQATDYNQTSFSKTFNGIGRDHRVDATFVKTAKDAASYTINTEQSPNGKITGGLGTVSSAGTYYLKATGDKGYVIDKIYDNGKVIKEATGEKTYTVTIVRPNENHIIQAAFRKSSPKSEELDDAYTVNHKIEVKYSVEGNHTNPIKAGNVTLSSSDPATGFVGEAMNKAGQISKAYPKVGDGTNNIININTNKGYYIKSYKVDGEEFALENDNGVAGDETIKDGTAGDPGTEGQVDDTGTTKEVKTYVTRKDVILENGAITKDHTIEVVFAKMSSNTDKGVIDAYVGGEGSTTGVINSVTVNSDGTRTVKYTPNKGYITESVEVDGKAVSDKDGTYVFKSSDDKGHDFRVEFRKKTAYDGKTNIAGWKVSGVVNKTYNGKAQTQKVTVKNGRKKATVKLSYAKNHKSIGKTYVDVKGTGKFYGTIRKTFYITPAKPYASVKTSKGKISVKVKGLKGGAKGEIAYRKKGSKAWKKYKASSKTLKLKKGTYYVCVKAYKGSLSSKYSTAKSYNVG